MYELADLLFGLGVLLAVGLSFFVSASAGLGGSLVLVPTLALVLGTKEGIALAAMLLGANNIVKVVAYRRVVPIRQSAVIVGCTVVGAVFGARLLVAAPERLVTMAVLISFAIALVSERRDLRLRRKALAPALALASGGTSGFSGTSGPLKGVAVRSLDLDRHHTVGAAAIVSMFGDITKAAVFTQADLLGRSSLVIAAAAVPLMIAATYAGRRFNHVIGERGYERLFWLVMGGYTARLLVVV